MISIIICSRNSDLLAKVTTAIEQTIGIPYEIISIDNSNEGRGICEVYNEGALKSKYSILCFMHEDILIHTSEWGKIVKDILEDDTIGLLGVAGSVYKTSTPCPWWEPNGSATRMNIIQHYNGQTNSKIESKNPYHEIISDVVLVDGVWFCCRKSIWEDNRFDDLYFKRFHFYDLDFSAQVNRKFRICVTHKILIEHFSQGSIDKDWISSALLYYKKWKSQMPFFIKEGEFNTRENELEGNKIFLKILIQNNYQISVQFKFLFKILIAKVPDKISIQLTKRVIRNII